MKKIYWWKTTFGKNEINRVVHSIKNSNLSQGKITEEFERNIEKFLNVKNAICVPSGSAGLALSLLAVNIKPNDEILIPNYTWIATANAVKLIGAKPILIDVEKSRPIIDATKIEKKITKKTKAIIPVHLNGRSSDMILIKKIAKKNKLFVIEDAAQAIGSKNKSINLGTESDLGVFSLSIAKTISSGQGGIIVTNKSNLAKKIRLMRTHGVYNTTNPKIWPMQGFNFKFTDVLASIGIEQLKYIQERINFLKKIYGIYQEELRNSQFKIIPVNMNNGEVPVYNEFLIKNRTSIVKKALEKNIELRIFFPTISQATYIKQNNKDLNNSKFFSRHGVVLPSGPGQKIDNIYKCIKILRNI